MSARRRLSWPRAVLREVRRQRVSRIVANNATDAGTLRALLRRSTPPGRVPISVRALDGRCVELRSGTNDAEVAVATFAGRFHLPPTELSVIGSIWDIGAHAGLTTAHFAELYAGAQVVGVEPHPGNFALAQANVAPYADRCTLLQSAVWISDGRVGLEGKAGHEDGYRVSGTLSTMEVEAISLNTMLIRHGAPDYVKVDVEGAERELLNDATEWSSSVRCISVECHPPYSLTSCVADLERLGFDTITFPQTLRRRARDCVIGIRRQGGVA